MNSLFEHVGIYIIYIINLFMHLCNIVISKIHKYFAVDYKANIPPNPPNPLKVPKKKTSAPKRKSGTVLAKVLDEFPEVYYGEANKIPIKEAKSTTVTLSMQEIFDGVSKGKTVQQVINEKAKVVRGQKRTKT